MMDTATRHNVSYEACTVCPRACGVNRAIGELGVCKALPNSILGVRRFIGGKSLALWESKEAGRCFSRIVRLDASIVRMKTWWQGGN